MVYKDPKIICWFKNVIAIGLFHIEDNYLQIFIVVSVRPTSGINDLVLLITRKMMRSGLIVIMICMQYWVPQTNIVEFFSLSVFLVHFDLSLFQIDICIDLVLQLLTYNYNMFLCVWFSFIFEYMCELLCHEAGVGTFLRTKISLTQNVEIFENLVKVCTQWKLNKKCFKMIILKYYFKMF